MGSPFTARFCTLVAERILPGGAVAERVLGWPGDPNGRADALPQRLAGALHGLVVEQRDALLAATYPPHHEGVSDDALWAAVDAALQRIMKCICRAASTARRRPTRSCAAPRFARASSPSPPRPGSRSSPPNSVPALA
jgi:hypothetical protein